jgi:cytochrome o ubiquinol oxidase subunit 3
MSVVESCIVAAVTAITGEAAPGEPARGAGASSSSANESLQVGSSGVLRVAPSDSSSGVLRGDLRGSSKRVVLATHDGGSTAAAVSVGAGAAVAGAAVVMATGDGASTAGAVSVLAGGAVAGAANDSRRFYLTREHHPENGTLFGFWLYLMSDCLVFACLFAAYAVLGRSYAGGPTGAELFDLPLVAVNTSLLLLSSITYGFAMIEMQRGRLPGTLIWLGITGLLGAGFVGIELTEFTHLIHEGAGPGRSAFLSSFFTLVGTHGLHVTCGIIWLITLMVQSGKHGLIPENRRRLMCLSMFWHFLDVVWIGVFTFVYLMGVLP